MPEVTDLRSTIIPKSDQLNSEQLLAGPMVLTVSDVRAGGGEDQPVSIYYEADPGRPFKPCKTMRKVLILAWGPDGTRWVGKSMELYCEPSVKFGGEVVGGIRIARLSDIPKAIKVSLTATKGRKALHEIGALDVSHEGAEVLRAIAQATNRDSMKRARAMAEALTDDADLALARAAYARKVEQLKSGSPAAPPAAAAPPADGEGGDLTLTEDVIAKRIKDAMTLEVLDLAREQIAAVENEAARTRLATFADDRAHALRKAAAEDDDVPY